MCNPITSSFCSTKQLVANLILCKIKELEANSNSEGTNYECRTLAYIRIILTVLSLIIVTFLHYRKVRLCRGYKFSNAVKNAIYFRCIK